MLHERNLVRIVDFLEETTRQYKHSLGVPAELYQNTDLPRFILL